MLNQTTGKHECEDPGCDKAYPHRSTMSNHMQGKHGYRPSASRPTPIVVGDPVAPPTLAGSPATGPKVGVPSFSDFNDEWLRGQKQVVKKPVGPETLAAQAKVADDMAKAGWAAIDHLYPEEYPMPTAIAALGPMWKQATKECLIKYQLTAGCEARFILTTPLVAGPGVAFRLGWDIADLASDTESDDDQDDESDGPKEKVRRCPMCTYKDHDRAAYRDHMERKHPNQWAEAQELLRIQKEQAGTP